MSKNKLQNKLTDLVIEQNLLLWNLSHSLLKISDELIRLESSILDESKESPLTTLTKDNLLE